MQLVEELLNIWSLDDYEDTLEELEEVLIVSATWHTSLTLIPMSLGSSHDRGGADKLGPSAGDVMWEELGGQLPQPPGPPAPSICCCRPPASAPRPSPDLTCMDMCVACAGR